MPADRAPTLDLKGARIGMTVDELNAKFPALKCRAENVGKTQCDHLASREAGELDTIAEERVSGWIFRFSDGRLGMIVAMVSSDSYGAIVSGLRTKFGAPTSTRRHVFQTKGGGKFNAVNYQWVRGSVGMEAAQYSSDIETSTITLGLLSTKGVDAARAANRAKDL